MNHIQSIADAIVQRDRRIARYRRIAESAPQLFLYGLLLGGIYLAVIWVSR